MKDEFCDVNTTDEVIVHLKTDQNKWMPIISIELFQGSIIYKL
jgi:hypothetical protein